MTNQEAKFILSAYRPGGVDIDSPAFQEALRLAGQVPELGAWLAREQAHAAAVAGKLRKIAPPAGLREAILAGARASGTSRKTVSRLPAWLAIAASFALLVTLALNWRGGTAQASRLAAIAVDDTLHGRHGGHGAPAGALNALLSLPSTRLGVKLPIDFAALRLTGCRVVQLGNREAIEICFHRNGGEFHLYVIQRENLLKMTRSDAVLLAEHQKAATASWSDADHHYIVVSAAGRQALAALL